LSLWDEQKLELYEDSFANLYIDNLEQGMNLVGRLLKENNHQTELSEELDRFSQLIETEFLTMVERMSIPQNASVYQELMIFRKRLEELILFPEIYHKKVIAVGGGFSAGKSKLINLIIGEDLLPTDTTPTTSIPTYIIQGSETTFFAHNIYGLKSELDEEAIKAITHAFSEKYNVSLAQIMKNILLKSVSMPYENIAILDTPGYSKSDHHKKELNKDEHMARVHLQAADCLIWVVDIEKGTIPNQDFEFIKTLNIQIPIFFVFNKADIKETSDIKQIIELARENVINQGIQCAGIGAISALLQKEYGEDLLFDFLRNENQKKSFIDLKEQFLTIFTKYEPFTEKEIQELRIELKELNEIALLTSEKKAQDLIRPLIAEKKKRIANEKDKMKQFKLDLTPFISSIEKMMELLNTPTIEPEGDHVDRFRKLFLQKLLKVNVQKMIKEKATIFEQGIDLSSFNRDQSFSNQQIYQVFQQAINLLQKDIKIKLEKEMSALFEEMKGQLSSKDLLDTEKEEVLVVLSEIVWKVSMRMEQFQNRTDMLTDVLEHYDQFAHDYENLLTKMLAHDSWIIGNDLREKLSLLYQETISAMLDEDGGQI
jgi:signal recognition particle receptor subunit beta